MCLTFSDTHNSRDDEVLRYLEGYSKEILSYIRFDTLVDRIRKDPNDKNARWRVTSTDVTTQEETTEEYEAICDCSGHYTRPYIPFVRNLWKYKRPILHAKWYRKPDVFANQVNSHSPHASSVT
jgi:cation diffusion facilitator CzcD-associated flavoprotein CzcO